LVEFFFFFFDFFAAGGPEAAEAEADEAAEAEAGLPASSLFEFFESTKLSFSKLKLTNWEKCYKTFFLFISLLSDKLKCLSKWVAFAQVGQGRAPLRGGLLPFLK
jgi:hypothetical protein